MSDATRAYSVWYDADDGIVCCAWAQGASCGLAEAREVSDEVARLAARVGGGTLPLLVDMAGMTGMSRDAREHFAAASASDVSAIALLTGSAVGRMIANFFIGLRKSQAPIRLFGTRAEAVAWLKTAR